MSKKPAPPQKTVLETVLEWSQDRPAWQRDALRRIVAKGKLDETDIEELVELCQKGKGAVSLLTASPLEKGHLPANPGQGASVALVSIHDVDGANNLAPGQTLAFEPTGITVIYGDNGAGKSGYGRILKSACRARHVGKIEPNVYAQQTQPNASATISYAVGGKTAKPEKWVDGQPARSALSAISVFDSDCASIHLEAKNEVAFRPFGLDVPDELAGVCAAVKEALTATLKKLEKSKNPIFQKPTWRDGTAAGKLLSSLKHDNSLKAIEALATLTADESARLERLKEDLSKNAAKAAAEQTLKADNIRRVTDFVRGLSDRTSDTALTELFVFDTDARATREAAKLAANNAFAGEPLAGVGGEVWRALWDSARRFSTEIAYRGTAFPPGTDDALCMLCQQPLGTDARARFIRFEEFIQKDTAKQAIAAERQRDASRNHLLSQAIDTRSQKSGLQEIALHADSVSRGVRRFIASARLRRRFLIRSLGSPDLPTLPQPPVSPVSDLDSLEAAIRKYSDELLKSSDETERRKLEAELAELNDRVILASMLQIVRDEVQRLQSIYFIDRCLADTATNTITKVGNDIADTVITPKLRDRFQEEIVKLAAEKVRVEIVRSGGKHGSPQYQVRLFAKPTAKVENVLSEGEKTCVALAVFLTELATADHRSALVFDDPISSLDHRWRQQVAKRLVAEAEHRQVIVFTHDLIFANDITDLAEKKRPLKLLTLSRGAAGAGMVTDGFPWKGKSVEDRIDKLEKAARDAKSLYDADAEEEYETETTNIYNRLRAAWERALEEVAFFRVIQRHRDYIDTKSLKKATVLTEADCDAFHTSFNKCSDIIDAHDASSGRNAAAPPPTEILQDIQAFKDWVIGLRDRQKKIA